MSSVTALRYVASDIALSFLEKKAVASTLIKLGSFILDLRAVVIVEHMHDVDVDLLANVEPLLLRSLALIENFHDHIDVLLDLRSSSFITRGRERSFLQCLRLSLPRSQSTERCLVP